MFKQIKGCLVAAIVLWGVGQSAFASSYPTLNHYSDVLNALASGDKVRSIMMLDKCSPTAHATRAAQSDSQFIGGMDWANFNKMQIQVNGQAKTVLATSNTMLVEHSKYGPVYNYVRLHVFEDDTVEVFNEYLDPKNYSRLGTPMTLECKMSNGNDGNAIEFFDLS